MKTKENVNIYFLSTLLLTSTSLFCAQEQAECSKIASLKELVAQHIVKNKVDCQSIQRTLLITNIDDIKQKAIQSIIESKSSTNLFQRLSKHKNLLSIPHGQKSNLTIKEQCVDKMLQCLPKKIIRNTPEICGCLCCVSGILVCCGGWIFPYYLGCHKTLQVSLIIIAGSSAVVSCCLGAHCVANSCAHLYSACFQSYLNKAIVPSLLTMSEDNNNLLCHPPKEPNNNQIKFFYSSGDSTFDSDSSSSDQQVFFQNNNIYRSDN